MPDLVSRACGLVVTAVVLATTTVLPAASNDDDVEWNGVFSTPVWRRPLHPGRGEGFTVDLRVYRGDITGATVRSWDGEPRRFDMFWVRNDGDHDIWRAAVAGTEEDFLYYRFEITDGADVDYYNSLGMWGSSPSSGDFLIDTTSLGSFPLGATVDGVDTVFRVWAPNADAVSVAGSFNDWSTSSRRMTEVAGIWQARVPSVGHGARYKYVIENGGRLLWRTDPRARAQTSSVGDSIVWRSEHEWGDEDWVTPRFEDMIIYELHVGTFSGEDDGVTHYPGRYRDVVDLHLDHLVELGVNVVELMPIGEFAGDVSWGYNPSFQFAPESSYGSPDDVKHLVDRCHQEGIAVILDVVFNHMGASDLAGNLLDYDGEEIYFYPDGNGYRETPWGPRPDYGRTQVRQYIRDTIRYWLEEYHFDGFRVDGTDFVKVNADGWSVLKEIVQTTDTISRKAIVIGEQLPNDPAVTASIDASGAGMDAQWNDAFHDSLRGAIVAAAFGDPNMGALVGGMNHFDFSGTKAVNYIESHDESAVHGRVTQAADSSDPHGVWAYGRGKLSYGIVMFTAGIPMILQGQELMEDRRFGDSRGHRIRWSYKDDYGDYFRACRDMTRLRRAIPSVRCEGRQNIFHVNESGNVVAWHRWTSFGDDVVIVASFNNSDIGSYCLGMPLAGEWREIFNSDAGIYGGRNTGNGGRIVADGGARDGLPNSVCITLPRMGLLVFGRRSVVVDLPGFLRGDCNGDGRIDVSDPVRHLLGLFGGVPGGDCADACDANGDDLQDVSDALYVLRYLFDRPIFGAGPPAPPAPWPACQEFVPRRGCSRECIE